MNSTMLDVKVDRDDPALLHDQVAAQIRRAIADGEAKPGERLPPARHLAAVMHVNTNTVLRALRLLRDEGLLELRPGHGIRSAAHRNAARCWPRRSSSCSSAARTATTEPSCSTSSNRSNSLGANQGPPVIPQAASGSARWVVSPCSGSPCRR